MRTSVFLVLVAACGVACSSTSSSGATCVEASPLGTRTVDDEGDPSCTSDADCNVRCTCANGLGYTFVSSCHDGVCAQSAASCRQTCTQNGSTVGSVSSSTTSSSPCTRGSSTVPTDPAPTGGESGHGTSTSNGESSSSPPQVYCANVGENQCYCGHNADSGDGSASCTGATCCASTGWPSTGACGCFERGCDQVSNDTCTCGFPKTSMYSHPASCVKPSDGVCCTDGSTCRCNARTKGCSPGETEISSCSLSQLPDCDKAQTKVSSCH